MIETRPLFDMTVALHDPQVASTPSGMRLTFIVKDGTVRGERVKGTMLPGGGDWLVIDSAGVGHVDVRATVVLDDGAVVGVTYLGRLLFHGDALTRLLSGETLAEADTYFRVTPLFSVEAGPHDWLNGIQAAATGSLEPGLIHYEVHEVL